MKKVMMLGGNYFQMTAVQAARELGYYVIDVDYLPGNPAHALANAYYNISTLDKEKVLAKARELGIDGIVSYASDVSAPTAAYVAEAMGLKTNPYDSVNIMTHKDLFRDFLRENGFACPMGATFVDFAEAYAFFLRQDKTMVVKPIDASGSKGVSKVEAKECFEDAWKEAKKYSRSGKVIIEEFIERVGYQIDGDVFVVDGKVAFFGICDQHQDFACNRYAPIAHSFPSVMDAHVLDNAKQQLERLLGLLGMHMGAYNLEFIVSRDGQVYFLEVGPRNGGNLITDAIKEACGVDLAKATVAQACGDDPLPHLQQTRQGCASSYIIHTDRDGVFKGIRKDPCIAGRIAKELVFVKEGDEVHRFVNGAFGVGASVLRFDNVRQMNEMIEEMQRYYAVELAE